MIAALPRDWSAADFLARLDEAMRRVEPQAPSGAAVGLPPFEPLAQRAVRIGSFPSQDTSTPQDALMAWPPVSPLSVDEKVRLDLALELLNGDLPFLAGDYLDKVVRKVSPGASSLSLSIGAQALPASYVSLQITGLPTVALTPSTLGALRDAVLERVRWMHDLKPGTPSLADIVDKARSRIRARRRVAARSMEGPPRFGERSSDEGWHRSLDQLAAEPGFVKHIDDTAALDGLSADLEAGKNPWAAALERAGMLEPPYISAALPDPALQDEQKRRKNERLQAQVGMLMASYGLPEAQALVKYRAEADSATAVLEALARTQAKPSFLRQPPLELDRLDWSQRRLPSGPQSVTTNFDTPFTDISVAFDLNGIAEKDRELLPLLATAVRGVGVVNGAGDQLDAWKAYEQVSADIQGAEVDVKTDALSDHAELVFTAHASSSSEIAAAVGWLENYILRPDLSLQSREALKSSIISDLQRRRAIFQGDEETWIQDVAAAYRNQDRPMFMHASSPFTAMRDLNRLRWRLEEPSPAEFAVMKATASAALMATEAPDRAAAIVRLAAVSGEFGEYLRWELAHMPDDSWRRDLRRVVADYLDDLGRSQETIRRLQAVAARVLVRAGARVHVNGSTVNAESASQKVDALLSRLPVGHKGRPPKHRSLVLERLRERFPGLARPVHVALVNESGKTGAIVVSTPSPAYRALRRDELLDVLALGVLAGGGGHSLYMRTWNAGLAYGNGLSEWASIGRANYYADRCPDPAQTLRFVAEVAASFKVDDTFLLEYSLADAFNEYRAGQDFSSRGAALDDDLQDGNRPEVVRAFKSAILRVAREPGTLDEVRSRFQAVLGRILIGVPGGKVSASPEASAFFIGPEELIGRYEGFVREHGEADRVIRLYPRDFWP
jgi:predicted secreted protein